MAVRVAEVLSCCALLVSGVGCVGARTGKAPQSKPEPPPVAWSDPDRLAKVAAEATQLEPLVAEFAARSKAPGVAVGLVAGGKLVWFHGVGVRDVASRAPVDQDTVFRIGSMSKAFISAAVLKLRDEGKLSLDDPAERYVPELARVRYPTADSPKMTLRQLLSHGAGIPEDNATGDLRMAMSEAEADAELVQGLSFSSAPGTEFEYSNLGFVLAGRAVSRASGMRVTNYVTRHVLLALGMGDTHWDVRQVPESRRARGYGHQAAYMPSAGLTKYADDAYHEEEVLADGAGAAPGGLWTTARDYARWVAFQLAAWPPRDDPDDGPVRRASIRETHGVQQVLPVGAERDEQGRISVASRGYALGWGLRSTCRFERVVRHAGGLPGYGSYALLLPDRDAGIFLMTNLTYTFGDSLAFALAEGLDERGVLPRRPRAPSQRLERVRGAVLELLASWDAERARSLFDPYYWAYQPAVTVRQRLEALRSRHGACRPGAVGEIENDLRGRMRLECVHGAIEMSVELTASVPPRIQALELESALPPSARQVRAAEELVSLASRWDETRAMGVFATEADAASTRKSFARARANHGDCALVGPVKGDGSANATFRLVCAAGEADLSFALAEPDGRVAKATAVSVPGTLRCPL